MLTIEEKLTKLRKDFGEDPASLEKVNDWEKSLIKMKALKDFVEQDICKEIVKKYQERYVSINKLLFLDETLTESNRNKLYGRRKEVSGIIKLLTRHHVDEIKQIEKMVEEEIENADA